MNDIELTPVKPLPSGVHDRLLARVEAGFAEPDRRPVGGALLAAAAAVALLVGVGFVVFRSDGPTTSVASAARMDRCWDAIKASGEAGNFPARDTWREVLTTSSQGGTVLAMRGEDGKPVFCGLTPTTVTASAAGGGKNGVRPMLAIPGGPVAGLTDTGDGALKLDVDPPSGYTGMWTVERPGRAADGLFVHNGPGGITFSRGGKALRVPGKPEVRRVDHPELVGIRSGRDGRMADRCLDDNRLDIADADAFAPAASAELETTTALAVRSIGDFGVCVLDGGQDTAHFTLHRGVLPPTAAAPVRLDVFMVVDNYGPELGQRDMGDVDAIAAGTAAEEVASVRLTGHRGSSTLAHVVDGSYLMTLASERGDEFDDRARPIKAEALDARGDVIWTGPVGLYTR